MFEVLVSKLPANVQKYAKAYSTFVSLTAAAVADLAVSGNELRALVAEAIAVTASLIVAYIPNNDEPVVSA